MKTICDDLNNEYEALDHIVSHLKKEEWLIKTPFNQWTIKDEISHIAYFDSTSKLSATDASAFNKHFESILVGVTQADDVFTKTLAKGRLMSIEELMQWWRTERNELLDALRNHDPKKKLPWYGLPMSAKSFATARLMETWAHGQDIVDALGIQRVPTDRLKHIAHLGNTTRGWSYANRQMAVPDQSVYVQLTSPSNIVWEWGNPQEDNIIQGSAEEFCLVVTKRRHVDDTHLIVKGSVAREWMIIAQAFAGPPADGPKYSKTQ